MSTKIAISACLFFFVVCDLTAQTPQLLTTMPQKCNEAARVVNAPEYKIAKVWPTGTKPVEKYLLISVSAADFTRDKMIALARQLNQDFCKETRFGVLIFDDYTAARYVSYLSNTRELEKAERGFYQIDRKKGIEYIQFSTERGKPRNEIRINLSEPRKQK